MKKKLKKIIIMWIQNNEPHVRNCKTEEEANEWVTKLATFGVAKCETKYIYNNEVVNINGGEMYE